MSDQALWITWYDLPVDGREKYFEWLHGSFIPKMLKRPGFLHAAHYQSEIKIKPEARLNQLNDPDFPRGNQFMLVFGGEAPHTFAHPSPHNLHTELSAEENNMLAMRSGVRTSIFIEVARVDGPDAHLREGEYTLAPVVQIGGYKSGTADEEEIMEFYAQGRMPEMARLPCCMRMRKFVSVAGWADHGCFYEFTSLKGSDNFHAGSKNPKMAAWTDTLIRKFIHAPGTPTVGNRIWPPLK
jgi:hypothetical protein